MGILFPFLGTLGITAWLAVQAHDEGYVWFTQPEVLIGAFVALVFGLAAVGALKGTMEFVGKASKAFSTLIGGALTQKYGTGVCFAAWLVLLALSAVITFAGGKFEIFEDNFTVAILGDLIPLGLISAFLVLTFGGIVYWVYKK